MKRLLILVTYLTSHLGRETSSYMLHPTMTIRPDEVMRSGIWQPFSVRSMNPVDFAQHEIDPFLQAIRPVGPTPAGFRMISGANFGVGEKTDMNSIYWGIGGVFLGALLGFGAAKLF